MPENPEVLQNFVARAGALGARDAKIIQAESVVTAAWVRLKCQFGCGGYGRSFCCPPYTPTPQHTREVIAGYTRALLLHCAPDGEPTRLAVQLEHEIFLAGFYKAFGFGAGPCDLCPQCRLDKFCAQPDKARPAMEACGIDVYATVRANGFPIEVVRDETCHQNYYGLILID
jgi:predicted metal-binding protein